MIIAFMGNDGSGKTTISKEIFNFFKECGFETIYKHEYEYSLLSSVYKLIGKDRLQKSRDEMLIRKKKSLKYDIWPILVWMDTFLKHLYFKVFMRKTIIVLDRYAYDQYLSFRYLGNMRRITEWLYLRFPKPDIGIVMAVRPDIAFERKKQTHNYPLIFYKEQTQEYLDLSRKLQLSLITTDEDLQNTVKKVVRLFLSNKLLYKRILRKTSQNRITFYILKKYGPVISEHISNGLLKKYEEKIRMVTETIVRLKEILSASDVRKYALIKSLDDFGFIGNDIDVIISHFDFEKILQDLSTRYENYGIQKINYSRTQDKGKMDVFVKRGLKLDFHSYIGWRNLAFFSFFDLETFIQPTKFFSSDLYGLDRRADSTVIAMTNVFEKGFLTLDEYMFLQSHFDDQFLRDNFPKFLLLDHYLPWLKKIFARRPQEFPIFVPGRIILRSYLELLIAPGNRFWKLKAFIRDLTFILFWRARYNLIGKLPFELGIENNVSVQKFEPTN